MATDIKRIPTARGPRASSSVERGFTLMELLVVLGIFIVVTSVLLAGNNRYGGEFTLQSLAYDVALSMRQAQIYGISVRQFGSGNFSGRYGVHVDQATSRTSYQVFADADQNNFYTNASELVSNSDIGRGFYISDLCVTPQGGAEVCSKSRLDVIFQRPEPDAYIRADGLATTYERGRIVLSSPRGDLRSVIIELSGGISVQK